MMYLLYVLNLCRNLLFVPVLNGYTVEFKFDIVIISKDNVYVKCVKNHNMHILNIDTNKVSSFDYVNVSNDYTYLWNLRLCRIKKNKIIRICKSWLIPHINSKYFNICESCFKQKLSSKYFTKLRNP